MRLLLLKVSQCYQEPGPLEMNLCNSEIGGLVFVSFAIAITSLLFAGLVSKLWRRPSDDATEIKSRESAFYGAFTAGAVFATWFLYLLLRVFA
ncbi:MAG: hypothetical protein ACRDAM_00275 [Casimicrobium sp.]